MKTRSTTPSSPRLSRRVDLVIVLGDAFVAAADRLDHPHVITCDSHRACANAIEDNTHKGCAVLVKGSRGLRMEEVINELKQSTR